MMSVVRVHDGGAMVFFFWAMLVVVLTILHGIKEDKK